MGDWFDHYVARRLDVPDVDDRAERQLAEVMGFPIVHVCGKL